MNKFLIIPFLLFNLTLQVNAESQPFWIPAADDVYLQEIGKKIETDTPVYDVAAFRDQIYAAMDDGVFVFHNQELHKVDGINEPVHQLKNINQSLFAIASKALYHLVDQKWEKISDLSIRDICRHKDEIIAADSNRLYRIENNQLIPLEHGRGPGGIIAIESYNETIYGLYPGRLLIFDGESFQDEIVVDWGTLPSRNVRDMHRQDNRLYISSDRGLSVLRGMALTTITGEEGLCYEDTTCLADGFDRDLWIGTSRGAIRATREEYQYFGADRWLPGNHVYGITVDKQTVYIATDKGIGVIEYIPFTLRKKAAYYERHLEEWGQKRLGFVHKLEWNDQLNEWIREVSDNDGGWSTHYLTAMCFKYAVTGDQDARQEALNTFKSIKWLEEITPIPGFPARSIWAHGEKGHQAEGGSGGYPAEWHDTPDGVWQWKGDTSSDEIDAHFYAVPVFHDLAAQGIEKEMAIDFLHDLIIHIIDNGWCLRDLDGKPTVWGRWEPEYLQTPIGYYARGLNGLEILTFVETARAFINDPKLDRGLQELLDLGYHHEILRQKLTFPPGDIFHSDDRLAFYAYYSILRYSKHPTLRPLLLRSLERSWEIERIEHNPWFNFIYGALTGSDCEIEQAVKHLREWPLDLIDYSYQNSHRHDLNPPKGLLPFDGGYTPYSGGTRALSPRERSPQRWSQSTLRYDGGSGGRVVVDPSGWLDAYWMARYHGMIEAPTVDDPKLLTVRMRNIHQGAAPYDGPPRPKLKQE